MKKNYRIGWLLLIAAGVFCFAFRQALMEIGTGVLIRAMLPKGKPYKLSYEQMEWREGRIHISGLRISEEKTELIADKVEMGCSFTLFPFYVEPRLLVVHPELTFASSGFSGKPSPGWAGLLPSRFYGVKADIQNGVLQLYDGTEMQRLYFMFASGEDRGKVGALSLSFDPTQLSAPLFFADLEMKEQKLYCGIKIEQGECSRILRLLGFASQQLKEGWEEMRGDIALSAKAVFELSGMCTHMNCRLDVSRLSLHNPQLGIQAEADELQADFSYPCFSAEETHGHLPMWKQILAQASIHKGELILSQPIISHEWGLKEIEGELSLDPALDPHLGLKGTLLTGGREIPLNVDGKGFVNEDRSFWLELDLQLDDAGLREAFVSLCSQNNGLHVLQVDLKNFSPSQIRMAQELFPFSSPFQISQGLFDGKITAWLHNGAVQKLQVEKLLASGVEFQFSQTAATFKNFELEGEWDNGELSSLKGHIEEGKCSPFTALEIDFALSEGNCILGKIGFAGEESAEFGIDIKKGSSLWDYAWTGGWIRSDKLSPIIYSSLLKGIDPQISLKGDLDLCGTFDKESLRLSLQATGVVFDHPYLEITAKAVGEKDSMLLKTEGRALLNYNFQESHWEGTIPLVGARLTEKKHGLVFEEVGAFIHLEDSLVSFTDFTAVCEGIHCRGKGVLKVASPDCADLYLSSTHIQGSAESLRSLLKYFPDAPSLKGALQGEFSIGEGGFSFFCHDAPEESSLEYRVEASLRGIGCDLSPRIGLRNLNGRVDFDSGSRCVKIDPLQGQWVSGAKTFGLKAARLEYKEEGGWEFDIALNEAGREVARIAGRSEEKNPHEIEFVFDSEKTHCLGTQLSIAQLRIKNGSELSRLALQPSIKGKDLPAQLLCLKECGFLDLDPEMIKAATFEGEIQTLVRYEPSEELSFQLIGKDIEVLGKRIGRFKAEGCKKSDFWEIETFQADQFAASAVLLDKKDRWEISAIDAAWNDFSLKGDAVYRKGEKKLYLNLQPLRYQLKSTIKGSALASGRGEIDFSAGGGSWAAKGEISLSVDMAAPALLQGVSEKTASFTLSPASGLTLQGIHLTCGSAFFRVEQLHYDLSTDKWKVSNLHFSFPPEMTHKFSQLGALQKLDLSTPLAGVANLEMGKEGLYCQANLKDGNYFFGKSEWALQQILLTYESNILNIGCRTSIQRLPLYAQVVMDFSDEQPLGMVKVMGSPKEAGVKTLFKLSPRGDLEIHSIQGTLFGLDANFGKHPRIFLQNAQVLAGSLKIDAAKAAALLPHSMQQKIDKWKMGAGYELEGKLVLWKEGARPFQFSGDLIGQDFSLLGCQFQSLSAHAEIGPDQVSFQNLSLIDQAGKMDIRQIKFDKCGESWDLDLPLLQIQSFKPSMLKRIGEAAKQKPLIVQNLSFLDIRGTLGEADSFTGHGHLYFTNSIKKDFGLFEIPLQILKDLGLDPGLLTPISGEVELLLQGDKCYLTGLEKTFSEGKRSLFYLDPDREPSYLDFDGNLHIDLKMKQDALLKLGESFTLIIRGTFEKPQYSFKP